MFKKIVPVIALLVSFALSTACIITTSGTIHTTVRVKTPPVVVVADDDPELVVIPGTYVYWLDGHDDVYFYGGYWWRSYGGGWYRADVYSGPWVVMEVRYVPHPVTNLPHDWRGRYHEAPRVHWHETRRSWKSWEGDRHWEQKKWKKAPPPTKRSKDDPFGRN